MDLKVVRPSHTSKSLSRPKGPGPAGAGPVRDGAPGRDVSGGLRTPSYHAGARGASMDSGARVRLGERGPASGPLAAASSESRADRLLRLLPSVTFLLPPSYAELAEQLGLPGDEDLLLDERVLAPGIPADDLAALVLGPSPAAGARARKLTSREAAGEMGRGGGPLEGRGEALGRAPVKREEGAKEEGPHGGERGQGHAGRPGGDEPGKGLRGRDGVREQGKKGRAVELQQDGQGGGGQEGRGKGKVRQLPVDALMGMGARDARQGASEWEGRDGEEGAPTAASRQDSTPRSKAAEAGDRSGSKVDARAHTGEGRAGAGRTGRAEEAGQRRALSGNSGKEPDAQGEGAVEEGRGRDSNAHEEAEGEDEEGGDGGPSPGSGKKGSRPSLTTPSPPASSAPVRARLPRAAKSEAARREHLALVSKGQEKSAEKGDKGDKDSGKKGKKDKGKDKEGDKGSKGKDKAGKDRPAKPEVPEEPPMTEEQVQMAAALARERIRLAAALAAAQAEERRRAAEEEARRRVAEEEERRRQEEIRLQEQMRLAALMRARQEMENQDRLWRDIARRDIPRQHRNFVMLHRRQWAESKRAAEYCQREVRARTVRSVKLVRGAPVRMKKLTRDMVLFWKRNDKEQAEVRRREEREAAEARRREEELREAKRQQQRLNFLLTQTELYSHFMHAKGGQAGAGPVGASAGKPEGEGAPGEDEEEDEEERAMREEAMRSATLAASAARTQMNNFDDESRALRDSEEGEPGTGPEAPEGGSSMDLLHPSTMPEMSTVLQPSMFQGTLKNYQLKGLQWLVNLYDQGLNGILADEMGLGKTIQAMSFLAHLAQEKGIWGPFLVVAPASVLSNWADEMARFLPDMKILPYWGALPERTVLRKNIHPKRLYRRDAAFHVMITSYQLLVSDEKHFRRVKWQYMVLDEAQAIKSSTSQRWKTLLSFSCRNRLLLTGTPIQNTMAELWALLHFIMPTLFDSHEQFNQWFSKGIEGHAEHGGQLNAHQLSRLHAILKPFMLRRLKKDVLGEMTGKKEVVLQCALAGRQQELYRNIKNKISVADLFDVGVGAASSGHVSDKKMLHLMNIVIQLRKVCNHPELFERNEARSFLHFADTGNPLQAAPFGELDCIHWAGRRSPLSIQVPKLVYREATFLLPAQCSGSTRSLGLQQKWLHSNLAVLSPLNVHRDLFPRPAKAGKGGPQSAVGGVGSLPSAFGFLRLLGLSPGEAWLLWGASLLERMLAAEAHRQRAHCWQSFLAAGEEVEGKPVLAPWQEMLLVVPQRRRRLSGLYGHSSRSTGRQILGGSGSDLLLKPLVTTHVGRCIESLPLLRAVRCYIPAARAPPVDLYCADPSFSAQQEEQLQHPQVRRWLLGTARINSAAFTMGKSACAAQGQEGSWSQENWLPQSPACFGRAPPPPALLLGTAAEAELALSGLVPHPLMWLEQRVLGASPPIQLFDFSKMLTDSGKLQELDTLLRQLKREGHRVLLFAQMTKMLNILEDYMKYRKYKYLRLDGSSSIMDRRDMVKDFQFKSDIFVFLLSTRAGGLGINLTAADTVVFYESDWNPTMDLQAMDRAHRLGQTKEVTVYRLICGGTVEEKIVKRAKMKNTVQQLVMTGAVGEGGGGEAAGAPGGEDVFSADEVVSLLLDDSELEAQLELQRSRQQQEQEARAAAGGGAVPEKKKRKRPSKAIVVDADGEGQGILVDQDDAPPAPSAPAPKAPPKDGPTDDAAPPAKKPKRVRKPKEKPLPEPCTLAPNGAREEMSLPDRAPGQALPGQEGGPEAAAGPNEDAALGSLVPSNKRAREGKGKAKHAPKAQPASAPAGGASPAAAPTPNGAEVGEPAAPSSKGKKSRAKGGRTGPSVPGATPQAGPQVQAAGLDPGAVQSEGMPSAAALDGGAAGGPGTPRTPAPEAGGAGPAEAGAPGEGPPGGSTAKGKRSSKGTGGDPSSEGAKGRRRKRGADGPGESPAQGTPGADPSQDLTEDAPLGGFRGSWPAATKSSKGSGEPRKARKGNASGEKRSDKPKDGVSPPLPGVSKLSAGKDGSPLKVRLSLGGGVPAATPSREAQPEGP